MKVKSIGETTHEIKAKLYFSLLWETLTFKWQIKEETQRRKSEKNRANRIEFKAGRNNVNRKNN